MGNLIPPRAGEFAALAQLVEAFHPDTQPEEWGPEHHATAEAAAAILLPYIRRVEARERSKVTSGRRKAPLRPESPKRVAERVERSEVRAEVIGRAGGMCEGPGRGLPGRCGSLPGRTGLEVHETHQRSTHPGSHLNPEMAVALCPVHHDLCTSPSGAMRELVEAAGLIVRASS